MLVFKKINVCKKDSLKAFTIKAKNNKSSLLIVTFLHSVAFAFDSKLRNNVE